MRISPRQLLFGFTAAFGCLLSGCGITSVSDPTPAASALWSDYVSSDPQDAPFVDFSYAGAFYGERSLPDLSGQPVFRPEDHGAQADDDVDDTRPIQAAIDAAERAGGGVVQFGTGRYLLNNDPTLGSLNIVSSNIVLRGAGQAATELYMVQPMPPAEPGKKWTGPAMIRFAPKGIASPNSTNHGDKRGNRLACDTITPVGATELTLQSTVGLTAGDIIVLEMESTAANERFLQGKPVRELWARINQRGVSARETQRIAAVKGNRLTLERPLLTELHPVLPWRIRKVEMLEQVGVQDLTFSTSWADPFEHHKDARHDSGYRAIELTNTVDSWVSDVIFRNVSTAASVRGGLANSVLRNTIEGNGGHFSFQAEFSTRTLIGMSIDTARGGQWHGPGASHMSVGTVVWRYLSPTSRGIDMHALFPRHTLIDQVTMKGFGGWGGNVSNLPNHLGGMVIWNFTQTGEHVGNHFKSILDFWDLPRSDDQRYGFFTAVDPVLAGYRGPVTRFNRDNARIESPGAQVSPTSLYEAQLRRRLGTLPDWINLAQSEWDALVEREGGSGVE